MKKKSVGKRTRRFLRRVSERKESGYAKTVSQFYGKPLDKINRNVLVSLKVFDPLRDFRD